MTMTLVSTESAAATKCRSSCCGLLRTMFTSEAPQRFALAVQTRLCRRLIAISSSRTSGQPLNNVVLPLRVR